MVEINSEEARVYHQERCKNKEKSKLKGEKCGKNQSLKEMKINR